MKLRKLHVRTGQELSAEVQKHIVAGKKSPWSGSCSCTIPNVHFHEETCTETYSAPDYLGAVVGGLGCLLGGLEIYGHKYTDGISALIGGAYGVYSSLTQEGTMIHHRKMNLVNDDPFVHSIGKTWTTYN